VCVWEAESTEGSGVFAQLAGSPQGQTTGSLLSTPGSGLTKPPPQIPFQQNIGKHRCNLLG
jgi:hypothetical protein